MKTKSYKFTLVVKTTQSKQAARSAVLCSFGTRQPDGCSFYLSDYRKPKPEIVRIDSNYRP